MSDFFEFPEPEPEPERPRRAPQPPWVQRPQVDPQHDLLRFGIQFADGAKAANLGGHRGWRVRSC